MRKISISSATEYTFLFACFPSFIKFNIKKTMVNTLLYIHNIYYQLLQQCFYLLIIAPTYFGLSCWPSSRISLVLRRVQLMLQLVWQKFYIYDYNYN